MDSEQDPNNDRLLAIEAQMERTNTLLSNATDTIENVNGLLRPMRFFLWLFLMVSVVLLLAIFFQNR